MNISDEKLWQKVEKEFAGNFMEPQVTDRSRWIQVETNHGTEYIRYDDVFSSRARIKRDDVSPFLQGTKVHSLKFIRGYGARLSAPGYLDCTEWSVFKTQKEAMEYLLDTYGGGL